MSSMTIFTELGSRIELATRPGLELACQTQVLSLDPRQAIPLLARVALDRDADTRSRVVQFFSRAVSSGIYQGKTVHAVSAVVEQLDQLQRRMHESGDPAAPSWKQEAEGLIGTVDSNVLDFLLRAHEKAFRTLEAHFCDAILPALGDHVLLKFIEATRSGLIPLEESQVLRVLNPAQVQLVDDFCIYPDDAIAIPALNLIRIRAGVMHSPRLSHILAHESAHLLAGVGTRQDAPSGSSVTIFKRGLRHWDADGIEAHGWLDEALTETVSAMVMSSTRCGHLGACAALDGLVEGPSAPLTLQALIAGYFESGNDLAAMPNFQHILSVLAHVPDFSTAQGLGLDREMFSR